MSASRAAPTRKLELPVVDSVADYEKIRRIGEGTYGVVYAAKHRPTGKVVALKKLRMERERDGMPVTSVREVRVLQSCSHVNLVNLIRVVTGTKLDSVFLVFEFVEHDIGRLLDDGGVRFTVPQAKCLLQQLLRAVAFLHSRWVLHRDLKMSNLLLTDSGILKLCDFGLARYFKPEDAAYTPRVVTLWYRAPELLLGASRYTEAIDMWSVGCIMAELLRGAPLFPGHTESETLSMLFSLLGAPSERIWPGFQCLPHSQKVILPDQPYSYLRKEFPKLSKAGCDLLDQLLTYDPEKRIGAARALRHPWLATEAPFPLDSAAMPHFQSVHLNPESLRATVRNDYDGNTSHATGHCGVPAKRQSHVSGSEKGFGRAFDTAKRRKQ